MLWYIVMWESVRITILIFLVKLFLFLRMQGILFPLIVEYRLGFMNFKYVRIRGKNHFER